MKSFLDLAETDTIHSTPVTEENETEGLIEINGEALDGYFGWAELRETKDGVWLVSIQAGCEDEEDARELFEKLTAERVK